MVNNTTYEGVIFLGVKIGIPRALYFYKYYPFAKTFLTELGAEIIPSPETNKEILNTGSRYCIDDACLPVKVCHGHIDNLKDKVDFILVPRLTSISSKEYICPKFGGLPEMVKFSMTELPPILDIEFDLYKKKTNLVKSLYSLGFTINKNPFKIRKAIKKALWKHKLYKSSLLKGYSPEWLIDGVKRNAPTKSPLIGIVSHPYLLYDNFLNMGLQEKLYKNNIKYITPEMISPKTIDDICNDLEKRMFWSSGKAIIGSALYMMNNDKIDGILMLTSFGCGIDSLALDLITRLANESYDKPIMTLTFDEHTGEANFNTRLEAFMDLIHRRRGH